MQIKGQGTQIALQGIERGYQKLNRAAADIASASYREGGPAVNEAMVALLEGRQQIENSIKTLEHMNEVLDSLLEATAVTADR